MNSTSRWLGVGAFCVFAITFLSLNAAAVTCPSDKDTLVTGDFGQRNANDALNDYALLFEDTTAGVTCQQLARDRLLQKLKNIFGIDDPALLNTAPINTHTDLLQRQNILPFQGWLEGADGAMLFVLAYRLNSLNLLDEGLAKYVDKAADLLTETATPTGIQPTNDTTALYTQPFIALTSLEPVCGLDVQHGWSDECMDDYSVASAGMAWAAAYGSLRGKNVQETVRKTNLLINETFSGRASVCLVPKDIIDPAKHAPAMTAGDTNSGDLQPVGENQRGPCQATPADVQGGTAVVFAQNHGPENPAYGFGLMTSISTAIVALQLANSNHSFFEYEKIVAKGLLDAGQRVTNGNQFAPTGCYGFNPTADKMFFTYDNLRNCAADVPPYYPDMFPVRAFYLDLIQLGVAEPLPLSFNSSRFGSDDNDLVNGFFGAGRKLYYGSLGWDNRMQLLGLLVRNYAGFVDHAGCDTIFGWAADRDQLNTAITASIYNNGTLLMTVPANSSRPDVGTLLGDNGLHGFGITTPTSLLDGTTHQISVRFDNSVTQLNGSPVSLTCSAPLYVGFLDHVGCSTIFGWAADRNRLNTAISATLYDNGVPLTTVLANGSRPDVGAFLGDNGLHGFSIATPASLQDGNLHLVSAKFENSSTELGTSPVSITCPHANVGITSSGNSVYGQSLSFTARVTGLGSAAVPTGTVTFLDGNQVLGTAQLDNFSRAVLNTTLVGAGSRLITASYSGDSVFPASSGQFIQAVSPAPLFASAASASRPYGAVNPVFSGTLSGLQNGDNITANYFTAATAASNVGTYAIIPTLSDSGSKLGNYTVTTQNGILTVTVVPLSITVNPATRFYGDPDPVFTGTISGLRNNDNITAVYQSSANVASGIGTYSLTATLLDPNGKLSNYSVSQVPGMLTVQPAPLLVKVDSKTRKIGVPNPALSGNITGIRNLDNIQGQYSTTATIDSPEGIYPIVATLLDPDNKLVNYSVTIQNGTLTISTVKK